MRVRKPAEERKSEIVETALRLADKVGPDRLATGQIAEAVGLTQAALFRHIPKKKDLWEAIAARIGEKFQKRWNAIERGPVVPVDRIRALVTEIVRAASREMVCQYVEISVGADY